MKEYLLRVVGPAAVIVVEVEAPTRVASTATTPRESDRLGAWLAQEPERSEAVRLALLDRDLRGDAERCVRWREALRAEDGGIVEAVESLLRERG